MLHLGNSDVVLPYPAMCLEFLTVLPYTLLCCCLTSDTIGVF
jgi:hypothetical protein